MKRLTGVMIAFLANLSMVSHTCAESNEEFVTNLNQQMDELRGMVQESQEKAERDAPQRAARHADQERQISEMDCSSLEYMRKKYADNGDSTYKAGMSSSTAMASFFTVQTQQAYAMSQRYAEEMMRRC